MILKKKHLIALLSSITLLFTSACGTDTKPAPATTAASQTTQAATTQNDQPSQQPDSQTTLKSDDQSKPTQAIQPSTSSVTPIEQPKPEQPQQPSPVEEKQQANKASVEILSVSSPAPRNSTATLSAKVTPGATATITVHYKSGPSKAAGLQAKRADAAGNVSWSWHVGGNTTIGSWPITVSSDGATAETEFQVVH